MAEPLLRVTPDCARCSATMSPSNDVSFDVAEGASLAIVGESGSGKTTIARMLVGLERPTDGTITFAGHDRTQPARSNKDRKARSHEMQTRLPGPVHEPRPAPDGRRLHRRGAEAVSRRHRRFAPAAGERVGGHGRPRRPPAARPPACALRRAAPAGGDRTRARRRAAARHPRRSGRRARRVDPGAGAQPAGRHPRRDRRLVHPDQPRPGRRAPAVRDRSSSCTAAWSSSAARPQTCSTPRSTSYTRLLRDSVPGPGWKPRRRVAAASA